MRKSLVLAAAALVGIGVAAKSTKDKVSRIRSNPDPYPYAELSREPVGVESFIDRPDGTRIRVLTAGEGPTVVMAHGVFATLIEWNIVWDLLLQRGYRVVAFDQRGHGKSTIGRDGISSTSMASDYLAVLEHVDATDAILIAHSMGGFLAITALIEVPGVQERLSGLILVDTFAGDVLKDAPQNKAQIPMIRSGLLQRAIANDTIGTLFGATICGEEPSPAMVQVFLDTFRAQHHAPLLPILEAFAAEDRGDKLGQITIPTIVVCGRADKTTPPWQSERLAAGIPGARMVWIDRAGHMVNWEAPQVLVDSVVELHSVSK